MVVFLFPLTAELRPPVADIRAVSAFANGEVSRLCIPPKAVSCHARRCYSPFVRAERFFANITPSGKLCTFVDFIFAKGEYPSSALPKGVLFLCLWQRNYDLRSRKYYLCWFSASENNVSIGTPKIFAITKISLSVALLTCPSSFE